MASVLSGPSPAPVPTASLSPMLAQAADGPLSSPLYAYEVKWDGMRALVELDGERLSLRTRNGIAAADRFPELRVLRRHVLPDAALLDGEIVRMVGGRPDFGALQRRIHLSDPAEVARAAAEEPVELILFDLLRSGERWLLDEPWESRREELERVTVPGAAVQLSPIWADGQSLWESVLRLDLEGVMAKRRASRYLPGKRTPDWLKIKVTTTLDVVVAGWTEGSGGRTGALGALIAGGMVDGELVYLGHVGTGFDHAAVEQIPRLLQAIEVPACPFRQAPPANGRPHWVRPDCVCEVRHQGWSSDGRLRAPVFVRWRPDRSARDCRAPEAEDR